MPSPPLQKVFRLLCGSRLRDDNERGMPALCKTRGPGGQVTSIITGDISRPLRETAARRTRAPPVRLNGNRSGPLLAGAVSSLSRVVERLPGPLLPRSDTVPTHSSADVSFRAVRCRTARRSIFRVFRGARALGRARAFRLLFIREHAGREDGASVRSDGEKWRGVASESRRGKNSRSVFTPLTTRLSEHLSARGTFRARCDTTPSFLVFMALLLAAQLFHIIAHSFHAGVNQRIS